ncbi:MAG: hypothetical protein ACRDPD_30085 [Streptosporangiaceae bacterium]
MPRLRDQIGPLPCPDCAQPSGQPHLPSCPLVRGMEFLYAADEAWEREHPEVSGRVRELAPVERAYLHWRGTRIPDDAFVLVYFRGGRGAHGC